MRFWLTLFLIWGPILAALVVIGFFLALIVGAKEKPLPIRS